MASRRMIAAKRYQRPPTLAEVSREGAAPVTYGETRHVTGPMDSDGVWEFERRCRVCSTVFTMDARGEQVLTCGDCRRRT